MRAAAALHIFIRMRQIFLPLGTIDVLYLVYSNPNRITSWVLEWLLTHLVYYLIWGRYLNKISIKHQLYPKSRKLDAFEPKYMKCHSSGNECEQCINFIEWMHDIYTRKMTWLCRIFIVKLFIYWLQDGLWKYAILHDTNMFSNLH